jgi:hypothetical protein
MWSDIKEVARELRAELLVTTSRIEATRRISEIRQFPPQQFKGNESIPFIKYDDLVNRFNDFRPLSLGKHEAQVIALQLLLTSNRFGTFDKKWKAIPWSFMLCTYLGNIDNMLKHLAYGYSKQDYWRNIEGIVRIADNPGDGIQVFTIGQGKSAERTTTHGQPHSVLVGVHFLIDYGFATVIKQTDEQDMLAPTAKLIERAQEQIALAA